MIENIEDTGERLVPENFKSKEDYLIYLRHIFAYELVSKLVSHDDIVLEVGCGEGYGAHFLSKTVYKIIALDVDEQLIEYAKGKYKYKNCIFQVYNGEELPFREGSFDAVISFQVIEHVQDDKNFISEIHRVLRKQGIFILTTPNRIYRLRPGQKPWNPFHVREYYPWELESLLKSVFWQVRVQGIGGKEEVQKIEINRVKPNPIVYLDFMNLRRFLPQSIKNRLVTTMSKKRHKLQDDWLFKYTTKDFYVMDNTDESLDLFGVCKK